MCVCLQVQDISFTLDSRWVAITTLHGTTHIFPVTPYGGKSKTDTWGDTGCHGVCHKYINNIFHIYWWHCGKPSGKLNPHISNLVIIILFTKGFTLLNNSYLLNIKCIKFSMDLKPPMAKFPTMMWLPHYSICNLIIFNIFLMMTLLYTSTTENLF